jgi:hypothetical protein
MSFLTDHNNPIVEALSEQEFADIGKRRIMQRSLRRAAAVNAVVLAREHAGRQDEAFSQNDADVILAIVELLDRTSGA